jgi:hypothetical protein
MVKVHAPSTTAGLGHMEVITLRHERDVASEILFEGLANEVNPAMKGQAILARQIAVALLTEDWLQFLVQKDIAVGRLVISFAEVAEREQSSFGLGFLIGMLGLALDAALQQGQAFTGEIVGGYIAPGPKPNELLKIQLRQVAGLEAKTRACADAGCGILYYPFEHEDVDIARAEIDYWPGVRPQACRLTPLNSQLPVASLLNLAINLTPLWQRAETHPNGPHFAFHLLEAMRISCNDAEFPAGVGGFLARLRNQGAIDDKSDSVFRACFDRWRKACPPDKLHELLKAVISKDPSWPLDASSVEAASPDAETDIARWLTEMRLSNGAELEPALAILHACRQLATDFGPYQSAARRVITEAADLITQAADRLLGVPSAQQLSNLIAACARFVVHVQDIDASALPQLARVLEKIFRLTEQIGPSGKQSLQASIRNILYQIHVASVVSSKDIPERDPMALLQVEFSVASPTTADDGRFRYVNDLQVTFNAGASVSCTLPSPSLLFDSSWQQCRSFSRRASFALADDAMHRLPLAEMEIVRDLWNRGGARIGFRFPDAKLFNVHWEPSLSPWPPSIDAQLFVAAMEQNASKLHPRSMIDVGTGTGFLAAAALTNWPSLENITVVESLPMSLALACANITPLLAASQRLACHRTRFQDLTLRDRADLLTCAPPYLPERPLVPEGIEMATNGTALLEYVIAHGPDWAREIWISFSTLAWREFSRALLAARSRYETVAVLRRDFVPFRIPWLEPLTIQEGGKDEYSSVRLRYYENILLHRGLIDLDSNAVEQRPEEYLAEHDPGRLLKEHLEFHHDRAEDERLDRILCTLRDRDSRGYRFWHEVRCLRLVAAQ